MDPRDVALQSITPSVAVPRFSSLDRLEQPGHRFLVASDGLWLEAKRQWMYLCWPLAMQVDVPMPYGRLEPLVELAFGKLPSALLDEFIEMAKDRCPNECAAWIVWNEQDESLRLIPLEEISVGTAHVQFHRPVLAGHEHLVVDLHSHGKLPAFFSGTDDHDDAGEFKISVVVGNCDSQNTSIRSRICANGLFIDTTPPGKDAIQELEGGESWLPTF